MCVSPFVDLVEHRIPNPRRHGNTQFWMGQAVFDFALSILYFSPSQKRMKNRAPKSKMSIIDAKNRYHTCNNSLQKCFFNEKIDFYNEVTTLCPTPKN
jgi:hypothetical protein